MTEGKTSTCCGDASHGCEVDPWTCRVCGGATFGAGYCALHAALAKAAADLEAESGQHGITDPDELCEECERPMKGADGLFCADCQCVKKPSAEDL